MHMHGEMAVLDLVFSFSCGDVPADDNRLNARWFQFWGFAIGGPVFYVLAFLHLLTGQWHIGLFVSFY